MKKILAAFLAFVMLFSNISVLAEEAFGEEIKEAQATQQEEAKEVEEEATEEKVYTVKQEQQEEKKEEVVEEDTTKEDEVKTETEVKEETKEEVKTEEVVEETTNEEPKKEEVKEEEPKKEAVEGKTFTNTPKKTLKSTAKSRAVEDTLVFKVNVYINNTYKEQVQFGNRNYPEINGGQLNLDEWLVSRYGEFKGGNVYINGERGQLSPFPTSKPYQLLFLVQNGWYYTPEDGDDIVFNLNFAGLQEPTVYGTAIINLNDQNGNPVEGYQITFTSEPATTTVTGVSNEDGQVIIDGEQLDVSLTWKYQVNGNTYLLQFDEDNTCEYYFTIQVEEEQPEEGITGKILVYVNNGKTDEKDILTENSDMDAIKEGKIKYSWNENSNIEFVSGSIKLNGSNEKTLTYSGNKIFTFDGYTDLKDGDEVEVSLYFQNIEEEEYTITVEHQFNLQQINVNNGYSDKDDTTLIQGKTITIKAGEEVSYDDIIAAVNGEFTKVDDTHFKYNGDTYHYSGQFAEGGASGTTGSVHDIDLSIGSTFVMPNTDIHIIVDYLIDIPRYKVTVNYIDMETNEVMDKTNKFSYPNDSNERTHNSYEVKEFEGSTNALGSKQYDVTDLNKDGKWFRIYTDYEFVKAEGEFTGEANEDKEINMYYKKLEGKVIVHYVDIEDNTLLEDVTLTGKVGTEYQTEQVAIEDFILVTVEGDENGTFTKDDIEVTYIYSAIGTGGEEVPDDNPKTGDTINNSIMMLVFSTNLLAASLYLKKKFSK